MNTEQALQAVEALVAEYAQSISRPEANRVDFVVSREALLPSVQLLINAHWGYLSAVTGLDQAPAEGKEGAVEALYQFCEGAAIATLRVTIPYSDAVVPTICRLIPSASLYERELMEMFGVVCEGTPNFDRLLLSDDWPDGVYPLRKSFTGLEA